MSDVNVGHDYHLAEAVKIWRLTEGRHDWRAYCPACEWYGPTRVTKDAADEDATAHDISSNPPTGR